MEADGGGNTAASKFAKFANESADVAVVGCGLLTDTAGEAPKAF